MFSDNLEALLFQDVRRQHRGALKVTTVRTLLPPVVALREVGTLRSVGVIAPEGLHSYDATSLRLSDDGVDQAVLEIQTHVGLIHKDIRDQDRVTGDRTRGHGQGAGKVGRGSEEH